MRRHALGIGLALLATSTAAVGWALSARPSTTELRLETVLRLRVVAAVLASEVPDGRTFPEPHGAFVPLAAVHQQFDPQHRALVGDGRDAWGGPILYWSDGNHFVLLSYGADGMPEVPYVGPQPWRQVAQGSPGNPDSDLLIVDGELWRGPRTSRDNLHRVMADMRSIGTAIGSYTVDFSHYPESFGYDALQVLESTLEPVYIRNLPLTDPWEAPIWVRSVPTEGYALVSYGSDGEPENPYASWQTSDWDSLTERPTTEPGQDLIFRNGQFVRWPSTMPR
jgi:hypothetical protein